MSEALDTSVSNIVPACDAVILSKIFVAVAVAIVVKCSVVIVVSVTLVVPNVLVVLLVVENVDPYKLCL